MDLLYVSLKLRSPTRVVLCIILAVPLTVPSGSQMLFLQFGGHSPLDLLSPLGPQLP